MHTPADSDASTAANLSIDATVQTNAANEDILKVTPETDWQDWFQTWLSFLRVELSPIQSYELSLQLVSDSDIRQLNAHYRQKDQPTDVLAFAALESITSQPTELWSTFPVCLGDIVISVETAQRQSKQANRSLKQELAWLAAHGLLHLLGWDHPNEERLIEMLNKQTQLLQKISLI
ncbi:MAG: rRNA maturation RNase YbeY [Leptolyngbyaceae cyanobacterium MO_188.B28]|nr:rRNA maturation RNase YbeY [Leptolyngbyaceae cyanobacterium MO_188.B28]